MTFSRQTESLIRQVLDVLPLIEAPKPEAVLSRLEQLRRGLEPENEFAMILSWLGKCRLVHKLGQEQLPLNSKDEYRVPDFFAVFEHEGRVIPVLIEVKKTEPRNPKTLIPGRLRLKKHYFNYAALLGLPMLVAWKHRGLWALFEMRHAQLKSTNFTIDCFTAMKENLLGVLAGDFSYRLAPGTRIRLRIRKLTEPDQDTGRFKGKITDVHFVNPHGKRIPNIPHLSSLFMFWDNEAELVDDGTDLVQSFVVPDLQLAEFASRTLSQLVHAFAELKDSPKDWHSIVHDTEHLAHDSGRLRALVSEATKYGVIEHVLNFHPQHTPAFL